MSQKPLIKHIQDVISKEVDRAHGASMQVLLGPDDRMPNFYARQFTIAPGGYIPTHRHDTIEHQQVVVEGEMVLSLDGKEETVRAGDCIYIPPRVAHSYRVVVGGLVRFLCFVPATAGYQTEWLD